MFIEMKQKEIRTLKEKLWLQNGKKCPVLDKEVPLDKMALDHAHKRKDEEYSENKGVIREALDFRTNAVLGKLENALKRTALSYQEDFNLPTFLRNAADYFERGAYVDEDGNMYIHPNEVKKNPPLSKKNYNKVKKLYNAEEFVPKRKNQKKKPLPEYPKNGKPVKALVELFEKYQIDLFN
jgi:hypothetical protein